MDGDVFSEDVVVADFEEGRLLVVFAVLRISTDHAPLANVVVLAEGGEVLDSCMGVDDGSGSDDCTGLNVRKWADDHVIGKFRLRINVCKRMNRSQLAFPWYHFEEHHHFCDFFSVDGGKSLHLSYIALYP